MLLTTLALAADLRLHTSPGATVDVLPSVAPGRADFLIERNTENLREQVRVRFPEGIRSVRAIDLGGEWQVSVWLEAPYASVSVGAIDGGWIVSPQVQAPTEWVPSNGEYDIDALVGGTALTGQCEPTAIPLSPLSGRDRPFGLDAGGFEPGLPVWGVAEPATVSWEVLGSSRRAMIATSDRHDRALWTYRVASLHRELGQAREAAYYFGVASGLEAGDEGIAALQRAAMLIRTGRWQAARDAAREAHRQGAGDDGVIAVLAAAAMDAGSDDSVALARALSATAARPMPLLLAGALLARAHCDEESIPLFRLAAGRLGGESGAIARLFLSDALFLVGKPDSAASALSDVRVSALRPAWRGIPGVRGQLFAIAARSPDTWPSAEPGLVQAAGNRDVAAIDALHAIAQIRAAMGDTGGALASWGAVLDRRPELAQGVPGARLAAVWEERITTMLEEDRPFDAITLHAGSWRPFMVGKIVNLGLLDAVATAYDNAGLPDVALTTLRTLVGEGGRRGLDTRASGLAAARLYVRTERFAEALESTAWLRGQRVDTAERGAIALVEADAFGALHRDGEAEAALREAASIAETRAVAEVRLALRAADDDGCGAALPVLEGAAARPVEGVDDAFVHAVLARCLIAVGRESEAAAALAGEAGRTSDAAHGEFATYMAAHVSGDAAPAMLKDAVANSPTVWGALAREAAADAAFRKGRGE